jgi:hypothetical protein
VKPLGLKASRAAPMLLVGTLLMSCGTRSASFPTSDPNEPAKPRVAPGITVDPVLQLPGATSSSSTATGLAVLSTPRGVSAVQRTIARFFRAMVSEAPEELDAVLSDQAFIDSSAGRQPARGALRSRFAQLDYTVLRDVPLYREQDVEIYRPTDAQALASYRAALPSELPKDQIFVRVRLAVSYAGKSRVLPDEMGFFLRPDRDQYRIASLREDPPIP